MDIIWTLFCYLVLISSIFSRRMTVLKEKSLWIYRLIGLVIIIFITYIVDIDGPTYLFGIGIGIHLIKVKLLNIDQATESQIKNSLDYEERVNDKTENTTVATSISDKIKEKIQFAKEHYKFLIFLISCAVIFMIVSQSYYDYQDSNKNQQQTSNVIKDESNNSQDKILTVDDICLDPSKYEGKNVTIKGTILNGTVPVNDDIGDLKPPLYGSDDKYVILNGEWPDKENVNNVLVTGTITTQGDDIILNVEKYNFDKAIAIESTQTESSDSTFGKMREAASSYAYLNWNQFLRDPTSLAGTYIYIPGEVIDVNYENGMTNGLIDTQGNGNIDDMVSFVISGTVYDINVGQIIAPMGTISSQTGMATNNITYETVETPLIEVSDPNLWKTSYEIDLNDKEITELMYGTYVAIDDNDIDESLGSKFDFTGNSIGGHKYSYKESIYSNPVISITSSGLMRGYDNMRISMDLIADGIGDSIGDSELKVTTVSIYLKDGIMSVDADGGHTSKYKK